MDGHDHHHNHKVGSVGKEAGNMQVQENSQHAAPLHDHADHHSHHVHDHSDSLRRLKSAEGHLRGIQRMLEEDVYCIDVLRQIQAVQAALNKISVNILNQHLNTCVITAVRGEDLQERERVLKEIAEVYDMATRV